MNDDYPALCTGCEQFVYENESSDPCPNCFPEERDAAAFRRMDERLQREYEGTFHAELRRVIEQAEGTPLAALVPQAQALLALPEDSVAALVTAARNMTDTAVAWERIIEYTR